jgi:hypothetical protein
LRGGATGRREASGTGLGAAGYRVTTYRCFYWGGRETRRERVSDDTYRSVDYALEPTPQTRGAPGG